MMKSASIILLAALAIGCSKKERVLNPNVGLAPVVFESEVGQQIFVDVIRDKYDSGAARIPPGLLSKNAYYNREVGTADENGDGILSDFEVQKYADH